MKFRGSAVPHPKQLMFKKRGTPPPSSLTLPFFFSLHLPYKNNTEYRFGSIEYQQSCLHSLRSSLWLPPMVKWAIPASLRVGTWFVPSHFLICPRLSTQLLPSRYRTKAYLPKARICAPLRSALLAMRNRCRLTPWRRSPPRPLLRRSLQERRRIHQIPVTPRELVEEHT